MKLTIECAHTGAALSLPFFPKYEELQSELSLMTSIPPSHQILLCGPPFRSFVYSDDRDDMRGKRIFLYDKRICFDSTVGPIHSVQLAIPEPTMEYATGSFAGVSSEDNLNTINIEDFLKCLRSLLTREVQFDAYVKEQYSIIVRNGDQQKLQIDAVLAAIDSVNDIFLSCSQRYLEYKDKLLDMLSKHKLLLDSFHQNIDRLKRCRLHRTFTNQLSAMNESGVGPSLYQAVHSERLMTFYVVSQENYSKMDKFVTKLQANFESITQRIFELKQCTTLSDGLSTALKIAHQQLTDQEHKVQSIRSDYHNVGTNGTNCNIQILEKYLRHEQLSLSGHERKKEILRECARKCEQAYMETVALVNRVMQSITTLQSQLKFELRKDVDRARLFAISQNENIRQLEIVANLPKNQVQLLLELKRRKQYESKVADRINKLKEELTSMREIETVKRKQFLVECGSLLPPLFHECIPSLSHKPSFIEITDSSSFPLPSVDNEEIEASLNDLPNEFAAWKADIVNLMNSIEETKDNDTNISTQSIHESMTRRVAELEAENESLKHQIFSIQQNNIHSNDQHLRISPGDRDNRQIIANQDLNDVKSDADQISMGSLVSWLNFASAIVDPNRLSQSLYPPSQEFTIYSIQTPFDESNSVGDQLKFLTTRLLSIYNQYLHRTKYSRISFLNFEVGDLALFRPVEVEMHSTLEQSIWVAFSCNCPYRFLAKESLAYFVHKRKIKAEGVIGKIIKIEEHIADEKASLELQVPINEKYFVLIARPAKLTSFPSASSFNSRVDADIT